jgi:DNA-binding response OmpR family regulator
MAQSRTLPLVLVIEDDIDVRRLYASALHDACFEVIEAHNGLQAMEKAAENGPDVIVTDLGLPGIDGFELCRRLKSDARTVQVPIVAITGRYLSPDDHERVRRRGCASVLIKPIDAAELVSSVRKVLAQP